MSRPHLLTFGLGYTATRLASELSTDGWQCSGTRRSRNAADTPEDPGAVVHVFDGTRPSASVTKALPTVTHVLVSVPPDGHGCPVLRHHGHDLETAPGLAWIGYLSTTGVYGDHAGGWVDESTPPAPGSDRTRSRLEAEQAWLERAEALGVPCYLFRLSGIYGPGRSQLDRLRDGNARRLTGHGTIFNRVHVDDIVGAVKTALKRPTPPGVYNVSDDLPAAPEDVVVYAAGLLGMDPPPATPMEQAEISPMLRSFYAESRRVKNDRMTSDLGYRLRYPTYREGLQTLLEETSDDR